MKIDNTTIENYIASIPNPNTKKTYGCSLRKFVKFLEKNEITDLNQENIKRIFLDYQAYLNNQNLKPISRNQNMINLKTFLNDYTNITYDKKLKLERTTNEPKYLTTPQIQLIYKYTENPLDELMIKLLSNTGLRIHEALKITKQELTNVDEDKNVILKVIGKRNKKRVVLIPSELAKQLKEYSKNNKTYLFESKRKPNSPISIRTIQRRFNNLARKIDEKEKTKIYSENLKPHNLRHSFAIRALKTNEINYVKEFLGHESITTTQIYTNLKEKEILDRFKKIEMI
ncbi:tyrosine-type recombinase/integrase [Methanosphaera sp.]|uniref:tyrosine-type recombinase/integrase n=1 Tax=Methanosphaera sp. TaxID=2666342 RepID=UPI002E75A3B4|nr:tyrosine-type recombinase/integrase [Methanosphaera sp.]MEE1117262.1 tyrosine-type recombinase/integrase [Methanosphaera sp.]